MVVSRGDFTLGFLVVLIVVAVIAIVVWRTKTKSSREGFANDVIQLPEWAGGASGRVGNQDVLNEQGQALIRQKIDNENNAGSWCSHKGVRMPREWLHVDNKDRTCALDLYGHLVRNNCSPGNDILFPEDGILEDAYVDPNTWRCNVVMSNDASAQQVEDYKQQVDIDYLIGRLPYLRDKRDELEKERERLVNLKTDLQRQVEENEELIDQLRETIQGLEERIQELEARIRELREKLERLKEELREKRLSTLSELTGEPVALALDRQPWRYDSRSNRIRLKRGYQMCIKVVRDDSRVYKHQNNYVALMMNGNDQYTVRHHGHALSLDPLNGSGPEYDFAFRVRYDKEGIVLLNDYGGTSYVGYDEENDEVTLYGSEDRKRAWQPRECVKSAPITLGPLAPWSLPGGFCCTHSGIVLQAYEGFVLGRTVILANKDGRIKVRLSYEHNPLSGHLDSKDYDVKRGVQMIDLDMVVPASGKYFLWHDRLRSGTPDCFLLRSESESVIPERYLRKYGDTVRVLKMRNASLRFDWRRFWYNFYGIEVFPENAVPEERGGPERVKEATRDAAKRGRLVLGMAQAPLEAVNPVSYDDFFNKVIFYKESNVPDRVKNDKPTIVDDERLLHFNDINAMDLIKDMPFRYFIILLAGETPSLRYEIDAKRSGKYKIEAYVVAIQGNTDSFYMQIDDGGKDWWDMHAYRQTRIGWLTYKTVSLSAGIHTVTFHPREPTGLAAVKVSYVGTGGGDGGGGGGGSNGRLPVSTDGRCGPSRGTRCPGDKCCSVFDWCARSEQHCDTYIRDDRKYHGPDWTPW